MGIQVFLSVHGVQRPNMSFACTECFGPHNIEDCIMVKKAVKRYCSNNLKNNYKSEKMNSQDSEHEDMKKKATTIIRSGRTRRRPMHITTKHCGTKCAPMFDCSSTTFSAKNATTTSKSAKNVTTTISVKNATTTSNSSSLPRMQDLPATQAPAFPIPPSHRLRGLYWHQRLHRS